MNLLLICIIINSLPYPKHLQILSVNLKTCNSVFLLNKKNTLEFMVNKNYSAAKITGISLIIMAFAAMFSEITRNNLILLDDSKQTIDNILKNNYLFILALLGYVIILITDLFVSVALHFVLKKFNFKLSFIAALIRILYTFIFAYAIFQLYIGFQFILNEKQKENSMFHFQLFETIWSFGLIIFGVHLLLIGIVSNKSNIIPKWIAMICMFAGLGYILDNGCKHAFPWLYESLKIILDGFVIVTGMIEIALAIVLLKLK